MRTKTLLVGIIVLAVLSTGLPSLATEPGLLVQDMNGSTVDVLAMIEGKPALVVMWATWCPHCATAISTIKKIQEEYIDRGLVVAAINPGVRDTLDRTRRYAKAKELSYPVYFDPTRSQAKRYFPFPGVPWFTLIDKDGQVISRGDYVDFEKIEALLTAEEPE
ncbi:MAG: TlpA family protein disulfide reductase [bacterium]|nr:TlpA family protein disulfide reductase [bacterium]